MKKKIALLLATVLATGSTAIGMAAITFSDINNVPWEGAKTYITKVSDLGLMVGEENDNGTSIFRAKDQVTYCETVQLAYNLMKDMGTAQSSSSRVSKWAVIMESYKIPEWAYEAVAFALEEGIVSLSELSGFMNRFGGGNQATREDVAVIFGRALSKEYSVKDEGELPFNDKGSISASAKPYVALLAELNILVGDSDKNFNPKNLINRAEMAVVTVKTHSVLKGEAIELSSLTATGTVVSISPKNGTRIIELKLSGGAVLTLTGTLNTPTTYEGKAVAFEALTIGDKLTVTYKGVEIEKVVVDFKFLEESVATIRGTVNYLTSDKITIDKTDGTSGVYAVSSGAIITLNGNVSNVNAVITLIENGVKAEVKVSLSDGIVTAIEVSGEENTVAGYLTDITSSKLTVKRNYGTEKTYLFANNITMKLENSTTSVKEISNLIKDGIEIEIVAQYNKNMEITKLTANYSSLGGTEKGTVKSLSEEKVTLLLSDNTTKQFLLSENTYVLYEGKILALYKLVNQFEDGTGLTATIYLDSERKVSKLETTMEDNTIGVITGLTESYITIKSSSGLEQKILLDENVIVKYNQGTSENVKHLIEIYEKNKTEVVLTLNRKGAVSRIQVNLDEDEYDIMSGDVNKIGFDTIKIGSKTVNINSSTVIKINGEELSASQLYARFQSGEVFYGKVTYVDNMAKNITLTLESTTGRIVSLLNGKISISTANGVFTYEMVKDSDLVIRIDGSKTAYSLLDLNENWSLRGIDYDVELTFDDGKVIRIMAESL